MTLLLFLPFGTLIGAVARMLVLRDGHGGWIQSMLVGAIGGVLGGTAGRLMRLYGEGEPTGFIASLLGAMVAVIIYHVAVGRRSRARAHRIPQS